MGVVVVVVLVGGIGVLLVAAVAYDVIARSRHRYRSAADWNAISHRRRAHFRQQREARRTLPDDRR